jgi:hypothetical protein
MAGFRDRIVRWIDEGTPFELIAERIGRLPPQFLPLAALAD